MEGIKIGKRILFVDNKVESAAAISVLEKAGKKIGPGLDVEIWDTEEVPVIDCFPPVLITPEGRFMDLELIMAFAKMRLQQ